MRIGHLLAAQAIAALAASAPVAANRRPDEPDLFEHHPDADPVNRQQRRAAERAQAKRNRNQGPHR